jgi:hypothetical protein
MEPQSPLDVTALHSRIAVLQRKLQWATVGLLIVIVGTVAVGGYLLGQRPKRLANLSEAVLHATATHGGTNVAVATGQVGDEAEGIFILDYLTGNLQCWVFYPRMQQFGAKFETNITQQLPATKNAEYLLVTGSSVANQTSGNARPAGCVVYVVDPKSGAFAGYTLPWNRSAEMSGQPQRGLMLFVGGDYFRAPVAGSSTKKANLAPAKENAKEKAPATK